MVTTDLPAGPLRFLPRETWVARSPSARERKQGSLPGEGWRSAHNRPRRSRTGQRRINDERLRGDARDSGLPTGAESASKRS